MYNDYGQYPPPVVSLKASFEKCVLHSKLSHRSFQKWQIDLLCYLGCASCAINQANCEKDSQR